MGVMTPRNFAVLNSGVKKRIQLFKRFLQKQRNCDQLHEFLLRDAMLSVVYAVAMCHSVCVCVCVCVCVSVTLQYCIKTAKRRITQIMSHDSPVTLVF